ncbi:hypothetical protein EIN_258460 [Entamoeba invadens IP1]|uniref:Uncharacterized protein n=1 Tax=Entamoeba invadens IP1 TaxID=370355 RepID=A0A0A1TV51_ENTIV|nr:hypothetical protein EIN_258460 [Entamoeba invadens IP1]ELP84192.1 hypothetical protein EIN_258460 [Entamoeba invadens IP1]|eukprot:XP_004183538.1 hypothetical protein EIN_258460 [Entamoeba invadens IP1]
MGDYFKPKVINFENVSLKYDTLDSAVMNEIVEETTNRNIQTLHIEVAHNNMDKISLSCIKAKRIELFVTRGKTLKFTKCETLSDIYVNTKMCAVDLKTLLDIQSLERIEIKGNCILEKTTKEHYEVHMPEHYKSVVFHTKFALNTLFDYSQCYKTLQKIKMNTSDAEIDLFKFGELLDIDIESTSPTHCTLTLPNINRRPTTFNTKDYSRPYKATLVFKSKSAKLCVYNLRNLTEIDIEGDIDELDLSDCTLCEKLRVVSSAKETLITPQSFYQLYQLFDKTRSLASLYYNPICYSFILREIAFKGNVNIKHNQLYFRVVFCVDVDTNIDIDSKYINQISIFGVRRLNFGDVNVQDKTVMEKQTKETLEIATKNRNIKIGKQTPKFKLIGNLFYFVAEHLTEDDKEDIKFDTNRKRKMGKSQQKTKHSKNMLCVEQQYDDHFINSEDVDSNDSECE